MGGPDRLGFSSTSEIALSGGGVVQFFRKGGSLTAIYWHPVHGTRSVSGTGAFYHYWLANGYVSRLGYPVTDEHLGQTDVCTCGFRPALT